MHTRVPAGLASRAPTPLRLHFARSVPAHTYAQFDGEIYKALIVYKTMMTAYSGLAVFAVLRGLNL